MVSKAGSVSVGLAASLVLVGCCAPPRMVEVPVAVEVPGPPRLVELPAELLNCGELPAVLVSGMTGGELRDAALAWQSFGQCFQGQADQVRRLEANEKKGRPSEPGRPGGAIAPTR